MPRAQRDLNPIKSSSAQGLWVERQCSGKMLDYQSRGTRFDTQLGPEFSETPFVSHPTRGELV